MKLKDLTKKLQEKPLQDEEVEFLIFSKEGGNIVCAELQGNEVIEIFRILAKERGKSRKPR